MKTTGKLQFVLIITAIIVLGPTFSSFSAKHESANQNVTKAINDVNVNITINSETTQKEFEDIMDMLKEHDIKGSFKNIKRNADGQITSIKIELEDLNTGSQSVSNIKSSSPIQEIYFGRKNKSLYITQGKDGFGNFAFFGNKMPNHSFSMDSIFRNQFHMLDSIRGHLFNFDDEDGNMFLFNGKSFNIDDMMKDMHDMITIDEDENGNKRITIKGDKSGGMNFFFGNEDDSATFSNHGATQKFKFYDDPNTEKIIIIDGKESTFETLNSLAKEDKLDSVDVLKGKTAISLYGEKAKDGAIIATTKK